MTDCCDINFYFDDAQFCIDYASCGPDVENLRKESEKFALELANQNKKIIVSLSSGLDGQVVLHSFCAQNIPVKAAFMHLPGFNDVEYERVLTLKTKYNLDLIVKELNPDLYKNDLLLEFDKTKIPPYQLLHKKFLSLLPADHTFIQGLDGPDFYCKDNKFYIFQTAHSFVNSRTRAFLMLNRDAPIVNWERKSRILLSILQDEIIKSFIFAYSNIKNNGLTYSNDKEIPIIDHYDLYIKPFLYAKYWQDELEYFPKYQGCEEIDWVIEKKWHQYRENLIIMPLDELKSHLQSNSKIKRFYQR